MSDREFDNGAGGAAREAGPDEQPGAMTCAELVELITDYLEGALDVETEGRFDYHLTQCAGCVTYLDQFRETISAVGSLPPEAVTDDVRDDLLEAFRGWSRDSDH